jgi:23S rRNA pseudouridine1911/1915/1917 synthase
VPATASGFEITLAELASWILHEDERLLVVDKPARVLCHPSKHGPWSSLIGACREYTGLETLHMPSRLDRETSGVVVFAKDREMGSILQTAIEHRRVKKRYRAILKGTLGAPITIDRPIGRDGTGAVHIRQWVRPDGAPAVTEFMPLETCRGYTLVDVKPHTGRMHQIRVHAAFMGHPIVGDKIYGPDQQLFLDFIDRGWTPELAARLELPRHALQASRIEYEWPEGALAFEAPFASDLQTFWSSHRDR